jgi:hypothetical protein
MAETTGPFGYKTLYRTGRGACPALMAGQRE